MKIKAKELIAKYKHAWVLLYFFIYIVWSLYLYRTNGSNLHSVEAAFDSSVRFNEWFIIPYYLWFAYVPLTIGYFFFHSKREFYQLTSYLFIGMTVCLIVYTIQPNGIFFRPDLNALGRDNILIRMTAFIYKTDSGSNALPSIHCFSSIGAFLAIHRSTRLQRRPNIQHGAFLLSGLICLSIIFIKQNSIISVLGAFVLGIVMYFIVYYPNYMKVSENLNFKPDKIVQKKMDER